MFGGRRGLVAVLAAGSVVLGAAQASGMHATVSNVAEPGLHTLAAGPDNSGTTERTSVTDAGAQGTSDHVFSPMLSGNGRYQIFYTGNDLQPGSPATETDSSTSIYVRDLREHHTVLLSLGNSNLPASGPVASDGSPLVNDLGEGAIIPADAASPSISDDGRYFSYLTDADNAVPNEASGNFPETLVVCDRDPTQAKDADGNWILDLPGSNPNVPGNVCVAASSNVLNGFPGIDQSATPRLSGDGSYVYWVERTSVTASQLKRARVVVDGALQQPSTTQTIGTAGVSTSAAVCDPGPVINFRGGAPGVQAAAMDVPLGVQSVGNPVPSADGSRVAVTVQFAGGKGCDGVALLDAAAGTGVRIDRVAGGSTFLGDFDATTFAVSFTELSITDDGSSVAFTYNHTDKPPPIPPGFVAGPGQRPVRSALATTPIHQGYLATVNRFTNAVSTAIVAVDKNGAPVTSTSIAISGDGRYVAFATRDAGAYDGQGATGDEVVGRDLVREINALATPAAACSSPCTPGGASSISLDRIGAHVGFDSSSSDIVGDDTNAKADSFVRTWQPVLSDGTAALGDVQAGDSTTVSVPVQVLGFGPVVFGPASVTPSDEFTVEGSNCFSFLAFHTGESCDVSVRFAPDVGATGPRSAIVAIASDQYPSPAPVSTLTANVVKDGPKSARGDTIRTSVTDGGAQSDTGGDESMISGNGRWQVFVSASPLAGRTTFDSNPNDGITPANHANVFVRDLADPKRTIQISLHSTVAANPSLPSRPKAETGSPTAPGPNDDSSGPSISSDGRFVSFFTSATDIVPYPPFGGPGDPPDQVLVVCDRDPGGAKDKAGHPILDRVRKGTQVPDYACYPIQSGAFFSDSPGVDLFEDARLSGDGTRIAWVESIDSAEERVKVATISAPGGALHAPQAVTYVPSGIAGFPAAVTRDGADAEQVQPELTEDGDAVVYWARVRGDGPIPDRWALIRTTLPANIGNHQDTRLDTTDGGGSFLGDDGIGGFGDPDRPAVSDDGSRVAFALAGPDSGAPSLVYVVTDSGGTLDTVIASRNNNDRPADGTQPAISGDGRYLAFRSGAPNMHNGVDPPNGGCRGAGVGCQIVARDLVRDAQNRAAGKAWVPSELVSSTTSTDCVKQLPPGRVCASRVEAKGNVDYDPGSADNENPSVDETGSEISFDSNADDLVPGDDNQFDSEGFEPATDAFVHTWRPQLDVPTMDFGSVKLGSSKTKTFTIRMADLGGSPANFGPISLGVSSITGTAAGDYKVLATSCTGQTLHEGAPAGAALSDPAESCDFKIRFTPTVPGSRPANLQTKVGKNGYPRTSPDGTISYDPAINNALTGFGATPILTVNPTLDFGKRRAKDPLTKTLPVKNSGSSPLVISGVVVSDTTHPGARNDYAVDFSTCQPAVAPGATCIIKVTFSGSRVGVRDAVMVISSNAGNGTALVGLLARVLKPKIDSNPAVSVVRRVITVTGTNFAPNHDVEVGFDDDVEDTVKTNSHGAFTLTLIVLPNGRQGPRVLFGHSVGLSKTIRGEFDFLVVLSSSDPGVGVITRD